MNLGNDKWQNTQGKLGSSSTGRGEAPETRGRELESLLATTEYESPTDTVVVRAVLGSQLSRTAVYGPVRTVVWQGSAGDRRPYADSRDVAPKSHFDSTDCSQTNVVEKNCSIPRKVASCTSIAPSDRTLSEIYRNNYRNN